MTWNLHAHQMKGREGGIQNAPLSKTDTEPFSLLLVSHSVPTRGDFGRRIGVKQRRNVEGGGKKATTMGARSS